MSVGALLESLIAIARMSKSDFAQSVFLAPSALSLILSGKRLPSLAERKKFSGRAARALAAEIYGHNCHLKFSPIFPFLYEFVSPHELESFLQAAIEYALDMDLALANEQDPDYPEFGRVYIGDKTVLNMLCILLSDHVQRDMAVDLDFYSSFLQIPDDYSGIFNRLFITRENKAKRGINFHLEVDTDELASHLPYLGSDRFSKVLWLENYADCYFWQIAPQTDSHYLLLKDQLLILLERQLDGTRSMSVITHKTYLYNYFKFLQQRGLTQITFNRAEILDTINEEAHLFDILRTQPITSVYSFCPVGFWLTEDELGMIEPEPDVQQKLLETFHTVLAQDARIYSTIDSLNLTAKTGQIIVPLAGKLRLSQEQRKNYMDRIKRSVLADGQRKFRLMNSDISDLIIFNSPKYSIIFVIDHDFKREKYHILKSNLVEQVLEKMFEDQNLDSVTYSEEIWNSFLEIDLEVTEF